MREAKETFRFTDLDESEYPPREDTTFGFRCVSIVAEGVFEDQKLEKYKVLDPETEWSLQVTLRAAPATAKGAPTTPGLNVNLLHSMLELCEYI